MTTQQDKAAMRRKGLVERVRIRPGALIMHDHRAWTWPEHAGHERTVGCVCDFVFDAEETANGIKLTRNGFGVHDGKNYGNGAVFVYKKSDIRKQVKKP